MNKHVNKKGEVAMGTLIIFIAMILIAAVAAAVLISSIGSVQSKALETGAATKQEIGTNVNIIELSANATLAENKTGYQQFEMITRLASGSDPISLADVVLSITPGLNDTENRKITGTKNFTVSYLLQGSNHRAGYLVKGDVAKLSFSTDAQVEEDQPMRISLVPKVGTPTTIYAMTPATRKALGMEIIFP